METVCPGCGVRLPKTSEAVEIRVNSSAECQELMNALSIYTLGRNDTFFIHQVVVDAYGAQHYRLGGPRVGLAFGLIGLCLLFEHNYTGKEVQNAHVRLAAKSKVWPQFLLPEQRGELTVAHPMKTEPGELRDKAIIEWAASVWKAYEKQHEDVRAVLRLHGEIA